jgi:hypothetical protein
MFFGIVIPISVYLWKRFMESLQSPPGGKDQEPPGDDGFPPLEHDPPEVDLDFVNLCYLLECMGCDNHLIIERTELYDYVLWSVQLEMWVWWCKDCQAYMPVRVSEAAQPPIFITVGI